jgi:multidrug efflux system outer membrane protein
MLKGNKLKLMFKLNRYIPVLLFTVLYAAGCKIPAGTQITENRTTPSSYGSNSDTTNAASIQWRRFFTDRYLVSLIDTALQNNQELNITFQELEIARNEIRLRQAPLSPVVGIRAGAGVEKVGRYTSQGAGDASTEIKPGKEVPDPLTDFVAGAYASWELDIWKKLRNAKKAAITRYLSSVEGRNFVITDLVAEVANSYYELLALDNQLEIVRQNIALQKNALEIVKIQKSAAKVTELAVQKFEAEVLGSQGVEYDLLQRTRETENRINFLLGRFPQPILRERSDFLTTANPVINSGTPAQLLANRPDVKRAELDLAAAKLDVKVARAEFYPSIGLSGGIGFQSFRPSYLLTFPESLLYSLAGDLAAPLVNRNGIKAEYASANARQVQAVFNYQRSILNAYMEVSTQLSNIENLQKKYDLKAQQVEALKRSIDISNLLFSSARADYLEVLMTQRDAFETRLELVETKRDQLNAAVNVYRNLGGGWR